MRRYVHNAFEPQPLSTLGASFLSARAHDTATDTTVRLQIWDTAGQERFRALAQLYYRGCAAVLLVYSVCNAASFAAVGPWLREVRARLPPDCVVHVVGTHADLAAQDPARREVPFERCIAYVAENLRPGTGAGAGTPSRPTTSGGGGGGGGGMAGSFGESKRGSGLWAIDAGWDVCHEVSSATGEGIDEVFRVITRKIVEQAQGKTAGSANGAANAGEGVTTPGVERRGGSGYFDRVHRESGSLRLGGDIKRRSWLLGFPTPNINAPTPGIADDLIAEGVCTPSERQRSRCC